MRIKTIDCYQKKPSVRLSNRKQSVGQPYHGGKKQDEYT
jgi:hypothetical protein